jgi:hypothetical protein
VLLPETAPEEGAFQWLSYRGRWGEREKGFNNGPTGPVTKTVWREPFAWMAKQRSTSPRFPGGSVVGGSVTGAFCGAVTTVTDFTHLATKSRPAAIAILVAIVLLLVGIVLATRWGPVDLGELRARRAFGQLLRTARRLYQRHWTVLVPIGLIAFPIVGGVNLLAEALQGPGGRRGRRPRWTRAGDRRPARIGRPAGRPGAGRRDRDHLRARTGAPRRTGVTDSVRGMLARFWRVAAAQLLAMLGSSCSRSR